MTDTNFLLDDDLDEETANNNKNQTKSILDDLDLENESFAEKNNKNEANNDEGVVISKSKVVLINKLLKNIQETNEKIQKLLSGTITTEEEARISIGQIGEVPRFSGVDDEQGPSGDNSRIIEGVFDGENMIGPDGKQYSVPANYASKSKLIEGDILKLTITPTGTFMYKQIGPIDRIRVVGVLEQADNGSFTVVNGSKRWKVLTASVTYYKGQDNDEVVILVPKVGESNWAAVENIVRKGY
ncbi:MAG: 50S ribosomal protein L7/L12 [Candidatus Falkowbacteria bacterium GW2011_GWC2_38_22]|uniref:50S ribosomal protein L7/L12 n=1 Tax=Candidatus Falkowbacteria bacterium GW2011_GWE1_38_31 TaxID=1618638 RepID=A0A0G0JTC9_9BACT|nr:MAG: 50S ribosomal protein L7/L12 [Candidatus Falkowbacteria bacterium GW2011_GWF2_38_1205]KKQ61965.1 MAG: 50S ribosomal protein L7/L12 [Candidatus Falkowbacteria bacterium GW2011_GWC2_38_22]KKQ63873.1 MAG: 50S ribosomal protein L7/L12 [Candidatus Falkowbacteria bacterium GW2011_GWF1_38_22]KKQ66130.1 MAG: 50S ribosomal protein L7/L12 [Candidatus Falkowbacteria bacterium GW2011_GWE2_38_254]KKQ70733.1 MAG: 50S ribosomal protein L7/L12 [Candidatus Falkowbacteria bacterium GW2011_GWE1_38_31]KKQ